MADIDKLPKPAELGIPVPDVMLSHLTNLVSKVNMIPRDQLDFGDTMVMGMVYSMLYEMAAKKGDLE